MTFCWSGVNFSGESFSLGPSLAFFDFKSSCAFSSIQTNVPVNLAINLGHAN